VKKDYIADVQEAAWFDQEQSQRDAEQQHAQKLKMIEYKTEKLRLKHLKVQLRLAELGQQSAMVTHQPHPSNSANTLYGPGLQPASATHLLSNPIQFSHGLPNVSASDAPIHPSNTHLYGGLEPTLNSDMTPFTPKNELGLDFHNTEHCFQGIQEGGM
jgi:hypothetical protein